MKIGIDNKQARAYSLSYVRSKGAATSGYVQFLPGLNGIESESWNMLKENPATKMLIEQGVLVETDFKKFEAGKDEKADPVIPMASNVGDKPSDIASADSKGKAAEVKSAVADQVKDVEIASLKKDQLVKLLKERGVSFSENASKAELVKLARS